MEREWTKKVKWKSESSVPIMKASSFGPVCTNFLAAAVIPSHKSRTSQDHL